MLDPTLPPIDPPENFAVYAARLEAKLDVALAQHGAQLQDHERRLGEMKQTQNEHEARITSNALTIVEVRQVALTAKNDVAALRSEAAESQSSARSALPVWIGIAIGGLGMVLGPILTVLLSK